MTTKKTGAAFLLAALLLGGCSLAFAPTSPRQLELSFKLEGRVENGERTIAGSWLLPSGISAQGRFLQVSGKLERPRRSRRPQVIRVQAETVDPETGRRLGRQRLKVKPRPEDTFRTTKRLKKKVLRGGLLTLSFEPRGAAIAAGTRITVCVDLVESQADLATVKSCAPGEAAADFGGIQQTIFTPSCAVGGCHDAATAESGLVLEEGQAYQNLVNVPAEEVRFQLRVRPGRPEQSYLVDKLRGSAPVGVRMPIGGPFLSAEQLAGVLEWIENGALEN